MSHIIDMTGERFGKLIVLYRVGLTSKGNLITLCVDCHHKAHKRQWRN